MLRSLVTILSIFSFFSFFSQLTLAETVNPQIQNQTLSASIWSKMMKRNLPESLCEAKGYYLSCYDVDAQQCQHFAQMQINKCLAQIHLPQNLDPETDGVKFGFQVGKCVSLEIQQAWAHQYRDVEKCAVRDAWL